MFALVDCNNFYASCERVFAPHLKNKPVAILSNNDGCIVARSEEIKALCIANEIKFKYDGKAEVLMSRWEGIHLPYNLLLLPCKIIAFMFRHLAYYPKNHCLIFLFQSIFLSACQGYKCKYTPQAFLH